MTETQPPMADDAELTVVVEGSRAVVRPGEPVSIGRDPACTLKVTNTVASRRHAEVAWTPDGWMLRDLDSRNGSYVDGKRVSVVAVAAGTRVRLGSPEEIAPLVEFVGGVLDGVRPDEKATQKIAPAAPVQAPAPIQAPAPVQVPPVPAQPAPAHPAATPPPPVPAPPPPVPAPPAAAPPPPAPPPQEGPATQAGPATGAAASAPTYAGTGRVPTAEHLATGLLRIGRGPDNDIVLSDLNISRHHAEVRPIPGGFEVADLGSRNGTFLNGRQVARAQLRPGDLVSIGRHQFVFEGQRLRQFVDTGPVSLVADDLMVRVKDQVLLDDVSFALPNSSLLGVIGPSGCGKSTLVRAMTGLRPATLGKVRYDGRDLYQDYAELRYRIGMVPQDDVLHRQLTVRRALRFAAALRFADDVPRRQRHARVDEVLQTLGLAARARHRIDTLSGGQRKRTSVALELMTEPSLLFLDEPTSGLDPALDKEVMEELREIADTGRTVVVVTHSVLHLDLCDRVLVMCLGGTMGYFGPPDELLEFFGAKDYAEVFSNVTDDPATWTRRYRGSELYRRYVLDVMQDAEPADPLGSTPARRAGSATGVSAPVQATKQLPGPAAPPVPPARAVATATVPPPPALVAAAPAGRVPAQRPEMGGLSIGRRALHPAAPLRQYLTLCLRMFTIIFSDRGYALFLLGMPLALALIAWTVPGHNGLAPPPPADRFSLEPQRLLVVLAVGAAFLGIATAIREIVSESSIYRRERAVGLSTTAYLASKVTVFAIISSLQVVLFVYLSLVARGKPADALVIHPPLAEIMVALALVAIVSSTLGLLVSALVRTNEQTTPVLVVVVMAQLVLSGGLFELHGQAVLEQIAWLSQTRWGFAAGASTVDLQALVRQQDPLWTHSAGSWLRAAVVMLVQAVAFGIAARYALRRHEPGR